MDKKTGKNFYIFCVKNIFALINFELNWNGKYFGSLLQNVNKHCTEFYIMHNTILIHLAKHLCLRPTGILSLHLIAE